MINMKATEAKKWDSYNMVKEIDEEISEEEDSQHLLILKLV